jgi:hypothetical protein
MPPLVTIYIKKYSGISFKKIRHACDFASRTRHPVFRVLDHGLRG